MLGGGSGVKTATPCEDVHHRKINCSLQNALAEKAAWGAAMCYGAFHSAPRPQLRYRNSAKKNNCEETISRNPF